MPTLRVRHLGRYADIVRLATKYLRTDVTTPELETPAELSGGADELADDLEKLGPTFIKLGQLLSTRSDLLPDAYVEALSRLQDSVAPFPFERAQEIIETELGVRLHKMFREIDPEPVAAASLSQIHRAVLRDGRVMAIKVQRPGIREIVVEDMAAMREAAAFLERRTKAGRRYELARVVDELRRTLYGELDFTREAANLRALSDNLAVFPSLVVPTPYEDYSSERVLTMDFVEGRKVTSLSPLSLNEVDGPALADELFRAYLKQILVDGFFHADPHPGNVLLTPDGRLVVLDLGMVARVGPGLQQELLGLLLAISEARSEDAATAAIRVGWKREGFREEEFREKVGALVLKTRDAVISELNVGRIIFEIARVSGGCGLRLPAELTLIGKALLNLDKVVSTLDPQFDPSEAVRAESSRLLQDRIRRRMSRTSLTSSVLEFQDFAERLPGRVAKVLDMLGGSEIRVKVDALDEHLLIQGMQKIANRIAVGVVLAALIIGAALMMRVETPFRLFGYPGLAITLFLAACFGGVVLILDILYYDEKRKTRLRGDAEKAVG